MENCIFCKIVNGEIPSYCIYEDDDVKAFLDVNPLSEGHTLIVPKKHYENIFDIDENVQVSIEKASKKVGKMLMGKLYCDGITRAQNNGYGQEVKHYHMHIIPRYKNDNLDFAKNCNNQREAEEIFEILK